MDFLAGLGQTLGPMFTPSRGALVRLGIGGVCAFGAMHMLGALASSAYTPEMFGPARPDQVNHLLEDALLAELVLTLRETAGRHNGQMFVDMAEQLNQFVGTTADAMGRSPTSAAAAHRNAAVVALATRYLLHATRGMDRLRKQIPVYDVKGRAQADEAALEIESTCKDMLENLRLHLN